MIYIVAFNIGWFSLLILASIAYRHRKGRPVLFWNVPGARYFERFGSGHSHRSALAKLGGARNCLIIAVTADRLIVRPFFPFTLMFLPEMYGLDLDVPLSAVEGAEMHQGAFGRSITIRFRDEHGHPEQFTVFVKKPDELMAVLSAK